MICDKVTNLVEVLKAGMKGVDLPIKTCRKKAVFSAPVKGKMHTYCAEHFLSHWLDAVISEKIKLL